jgi:hypothetical protein
MDGKTKIALALVIVALAGMWVLLNIQFGGMSIGFRI